MLSYFQAFSLETVNLLSFEISITGTDLFFDFIFHSWI